MKKNLLLMLSLMATSSVLVCVEETDPMATAAEAPEALSYDYDSQAEHYMEEGLLTGDNPETWAPTGEGEVYAGDESDGWSENNPTELTTDPLDADE